MGPLQGKFFCPGGSLKGGAAYQGFSMNGTLPLPAAAARLREAMRVTTERLYRLKAVTICCVNGSCAGAGLALACACDFRISVAAARFSVAFLTVGLSGDFGLSFFLPRICGASKARELYMLRDRLTAREALDCGLVNAVHADAASALQHALDLARRLAGMAPLALAHATANLRESDTAPSLAAQLDAEAYRHAECGQHPHAAEAAQAFLEKRPPRFARL